MAPEESTVRLYHRLEDGLGKDMATVLVEHFATKQDLAAAVETLVTKVEFREGMADLKASMYRTVLTATLVLVSTNVALVSAVAVIR
jgi:hypothetical protein